MIRGFRRFSQIEDRIPGLIAWYRLNPRSSAKSVDKTSSTSTDRWPVIAPLPGHAGLPRRKGPRRDTGFGRHAPSPRTAFGRIRAPWDRLMSLIVSGRFSGIDQARATTSGSNDAGRRPAHRSGDPPTSRSAPPPRRCLGPRIRPRRFSPEPRKSRPPLR